MSNLTNAVGYSLVDLFVDSLLRQLPAALEAEARLNGKLPQVELLFARTADCSDTERVVELRWPGGSWRRPVAVVGLSIRLWAEAGERLGCRIVEEQ